MAIGDSFTEGMSDPAPAEPDRTSAGPTGSPRTWPPSPGEDFGYANLAVRGRLLADIVGRQVDARWSWAPTW